MKQTKKDVLIFENGLQKKFGTAIQKKKISPHIKFKIMLNII